MIILFINILIINIFDMQFTEDNVKAQKNLLRAFEMTIKDHRDQLLARVPHILKAFYDEDILDEEVLIDWGSKVSV